MEDSKENIIYMIHRLEELSKVNVSNAYKLNTYDRLCELAVNSYELDKKNRKVELKDMVQYFCLWWLSNRKNMRYYTSYEKIGKLLNKNHTTVVHHISKRKPSNFYNQNIACIKDFLM